MGKGCADPKIHHGFSRKAFERSIFPALGAAIINESRRDRLCSMHREVRPLPIPGLKWSSGNTVITFKTFKKEKQISSNVMITLTGDLTCRNSATQGCHPLGGAPPTAHSHSYQDLETQFLRQPPRWPDDRLVTPGKIAQ